MESLIKDNRTFGTVADFLKEKIKEGSDLSIVSAYFTIYAYKGLQEKLDGINKLRFLFGEPNFVEMSEGKKEKDFSITDDTLVIPNADRLKQRKIARDCADWIKKHVEIRSLTKPNFLHGKLYHIVASNGVTNAITGSSNFTQRGLGLSQNNVSTSLNTSNMELNLIVDSDRTREELKEWFNALWGDETLTVDVKEEVLKYLSLLYKENAPSFIYYKTLYEIFGDYVMQQRDNKLLEDATGFLDSEVWRMLYDFQKDGVKGAINKILRYNGCIIADSVGLGKTFEALAVIKYFELRNYRVLILCPKKLEANWTLYQAKKNNILNPLKADRFDYTVLYHTDMGRVKGKSDADGVNFETFDWSVYDLVVIDESHNFKGNPALKETSNGVIKMNRAAFLMERVIKSGGRTKVLMLSATPVNNGLKDLRNQINFITEGKSNALFETVGISNIDTTLRIAQKQFAQWVKERNSTTTAKGLLERLDSGFFKLLDALTIARSRKHIKTFYTKDRVGDFPVRLKPITRSSIIDIEGSFPSFEDVDTQIHSYKLSLFTPSAFLKKGVAAAYEKKIGKTVANMTQAERENSLIGMMKTSFMKRLESSVNSFALSMGNTIKKIDDMIALINEYKKMGVDITKEIDTTIEGFGEIEEGEEFIVGKKLRFKLEYIELDKWLAALKADKEALKPLQKQAEAITPDRDAKLKVLRELIENKCTTTFVNSGNKKILIFTAFSDTARYLYDNIGPWAKKELSLETALVTGGYAISNVGAKKFGEVLACFSPISKKKADAASLSAMGDIDILIATDCISEGQNLQDCDCVINYDIHWNPVRLIQRFGRIDRIGSLNKNIQMINFWPTNDLNKYLNLKTRVEARMALVDLSATGEDNLLDTKEIDEKALEKENIKFRDAQLKALQKEVIDLEDTDTISLTDFTLDDFRSELLDFIRRNEKSLQDAPNGLYAVVPSPTNDTIETDKNFNDTEKNIIKSGIIFCLRQKNIAQQRTTTNPLAPYFLVYVTDGGEVKYNYVNAKQILEVYRLLCSGVDVPYDKLCDLFNKETQDGKDMGSCTDLLKKAAAAICEKSALKNAANLANNRRALIAGTNKAATKLEDFELVTWLIIK